MYHAMSSEHKRVAPRKLTQGFKAEQEIVRENASAQWRLPTASGLLLKGASQRDTGHRIRDLADAYVDRIVETWLGQDLVYCPYLPAVSVVTNRLKDFNASRTHERSKPFTRLRLLFWDFC